MAITHHAQGVTVKKIKNMSRVEIVAELESYGSGGNPKSGRKALDWRLARARRERGIA
jgi:hypothetical protein